MEIGGAEVMPEDTVRSWPAPSLPNLTLDETVRLIHALTVYHHTEDLAFAVQTAFDVHDVGSAEYRSRTELVSAAIVRTRRVPQPPMLKARRVARLARR
jgi:hypothetical protein